MITLKSNNKLTLLAATMMLLNGCAANTPGMKPDCCMHLNPIYLSNEDSAETKAQIIDYLIVYEALCVTK